jgi:hypothetical protein
VRAGGDCVMLTVGRWFGTSVPISPRAPHPSSRRAPDARRAARVEVQALIATPPTYVLLPSAASAGLGSQGRIRKLHRIAACKPDAWPGRSHRTSMRQPQVRRQPAPQRPRGAGTTRGCRRQSRTRRAHRFLPASRDHAPRTVHDGPPARGSSARALDLAILRRAPRRFV